MNSGPKPTWYLIYQVSKTGGFNLKKNHLKPGKGHFLVYFKKSFILNLLKVGQWASQTWPFFWKITNFGLLQQSQNKAWFWICYYFDLGALQKEFRSYPKTSLATKWNLLVNIKQPKKPNSLTYSNLQWTTKSFLYKSCKKLISLYPILPKNLGLHKEGYSSFSIHQRERDLQQKLWALWWDRFYRKRASNTKCSSPKGKDMLTKSFKPSPI